MRAAQAETEAVRADNVALVERLRFVQGYGSGSRHREHIGVCVLLCVRLYSVQVTRNFPCQPGGACSHAMLSCQGMSACITMQKISRALAVHQHAACGASCSAADALDVEDIEACSPAANHC